MIICRNSCNWQRILKVGTFFVLIFGGGGLLFLLSQLVFSGPAPQPSNAPLLLQTCYETIGSGALMLNPPREVELLPYLNEEIALLAKNDKPGSSHQGKVLLLLKSSQQEKVLIPGEKSYLQGGALFTFSEEETPLWIRPRLLDKQSVVLEVGCKEQTTEFLLKKSVRYKEIEPPFFSALKQGELLGHDLFLDQYGGKEYSHLKTRAKLKFKTPSVACFVKEGDYLAWEEGQWRVSPLSNETPLALIRSISAQKIEIQAWDGEGFACVKLEISKTTVPKMQGRPEELFRSPKCRTASQISCLCGRHKIVLKKGDWLLHSQGGWRKLSSIQAIDDYIDHKIEGELFVFDDLKKERGRSQLIGKLFDASRTQIQQVCLPIAEHTEKKRPMPQGSEMPGEPK